MNKPWVFAVFILIAAVLFCYLNAQRKSAGAAALITVEGEFILEAALDSGYRYIDLYGDYSVPVRFEVSENGIRFIDTDCPDHLCEGFGFINTPGQIAVCLPNKTVLSIKGESE